MTTIIYEPSAFTPELKYDFTQACRKGDMNTLRACVFHKDFGENFRVTDILRHGYLIACSNKQTEVIQYLMTSKEFKPNQRSVRGIEVLFNNEHEEMIRWLIFDYGMHKSSAVEEVLIEMGNQDYAKYIEGLFEKRTLNLKLKDNLSVIEGGKSHKI